MRLNPVLNSLPPPLWPLRPAATGINAKKWRQLLYKHKQVSVNSQSVSLSTHYWRKVCPFRGHCSYSWTGHHLALSPSFIGNLTAFGLNSSLWKNPPVIIFLLKVNTSAGSSRPQCSCAQNFPVQPPPVCTSSTRNAQPCCREMRGAGNGSPHFQNKIPPQRADRYKPTTPNVPALSLHRSQSPLLNPHTTATHWASDFTIKNSAIFFRKALETYFPPKFTKYMFLYNLCFFLCSLEHF